MCFGTSKFYPYIWADNIFIDFFFKRKFLILKKFYWIDKLKTTNIGSGYGPVPSGNKPLAEPLLIKNLNIIWHH